MPSRIVRDGILTSPRVNALTGGAELFYRRLLNVVDDFGRYHGTPALLRAAAFPLKLDKVHDAHIEAWLKECIDAGLIEVFTHKGLPYIEVARFGTPRAKTSKFPRLQTDANRCEQTQTDASNRTVVVVESVVVSDELHSSPPSAGDGLVTEPKDKKQVEYPPCFVQFWNYYPRKVGKGAALKAWERMSRPDKEAAIARAEWFAGCWEHHDPHGERAAFIPHPATWLNGRRWEDDDAAVELAARGQ